jgi:hypothetical protein
MSRGLSRSRRRSLFGQGSLVRSQFLKREVSKAKDTSTEMKCAACRVNITEHSELDSRFCLVRLAIILTGVNI